MKIMTSGSGDFKNRLKMPLERPLWLWIWVLLAALISVKGKETRARDNLSVVKKWQKGQRIR